MPDLSNVMPIHIGITLFLGFFASTLGIFAARAIARCFRDVYDALQIASPSQPRDERG